MHRPLVIGQIWKSKDKRDHGRKVEILELGKNWVRARNRELDVVSRISLVTLRKRFEFSAKARPGRKCRKGPELFSFTVNMTKTMHRKLLKKARKHTATKDKPEGNLSAWFRHSGLRYQPRKGEKIVLTIDG